MCRVRQNIRIVIFSVTATCINYNVHNDVKVGNRSYVDTALSVLKITSKITPWSLTHLVRNILYICTKSRRCFVSPNISAQEQARLTSAIPNVFPFPSPTTFKIQMISSLFLSVNEDQRLNLWTASLIRHEKLPKVVRHTDVVQNSIKSKSRFTRSAAPFSADISRVTRAQMVNFYFKKMFQTQDADERNT